MGLNIKTKAVAETGKLHLKDAEGELMFAEPEKGQSDKLPVCVNLYGPGSAEFGRAGAKRQGRLMTRAKAGKKTMSADETQEEGARYLTDLTHSFENLDYDGLAGAELAKAVYSDRSIGFISDQVQAYVGDWENFSKGSQTN